MTTARRLLALAALLVLAPAAPASADDASVKAAWDSEDAAFSELGRAVERATKRWEARGFTRDGRLVRLMRRGERLSRTVVDRLNAEQASSPTGTEARDWAIRSTSSFARYFVVQRRFVRAMSPSFPPRARRLNRRAVRLYRLSRRQAAEGRKRFEQLGLA